MFHEIRRSKQRLPQAEVLEILSRASSGVLALAGDEGYPYAVPLSFVYSDNKLFFHSALSGHKVDAIRRCDKASFCVIDQDQVLPAQYTTAYRSVIAFGKVRLIENEAEKRAAAELLAEKYNPGRYDDGQAEIAKGIDRMYIIELGIEHMTGKEGIELTRQRSGE